MGPRTKEFLTKVAKFTIPALVIGGAAYLAKKGFDSSVKKNPGSSFNGGIHSANPKQTGNSGSVFTGNFFQEPPPTAFFLGSDPLHDHYKELCKK